MEMVIVDVAETGSNHDNVVVDGICRRARS